MAGNLTFDPLDATKVGEDLPVCLPAVTGLQALAVAMLTDGRLWRAFCKSACMTLDACHSRM